ncbi:MAG: DNA repair protein RecO [Flavobacteriales bacterium]|nr:DNA repair protein RecO [Flavobacteriales bacterium]
MLHTTRAVVLRTVKHTDRSTVVKACTELFGTRSYLVRTGQKGGSKNSALQPLSRVEMVVSESQERDMHSVRELRVERPYTQLSSDPIRGMLALFAQEVLYRTLREETGDLALFSFVQEALEAMDTGDDVPYFPLKLLVQLMQHLGISPASPLPGESRFDMREGYFFAGVPPHELCMAPPQSALFAALIHADWNEITTSKLEPALVRRALLDDLLIYYRLHVEGFGELRSPAVLHALLA